mgnify:CR=1 FL=1
MGLNQRQDASWSRSWRDWKPGLISALVLGATGIAALVALQNRIPNPYLGEGAFVVFFLCYSAIFLGYAVARGHDEQEGRDSVSAQAVRAAIPYTGKRLALVSLIVSFAFFFVLAAVRTPGNLTALREARTALISKFDSEEAGGTRLYYMDSQSHATPRNFWRRMLFGIATLHVKEDKHERQLLVPAPLVESTITRMQTGYLLAQPLDGIGGGQEFGTSEVHDHLYALEASPGLFIVRTFLFSLAESFRLMAAMIYFAGLASLIVHRQEKFLRQRLFEAIPKADLSRQARVILKPAGFWTRLKYLNPLLCHAFVQGNPKPYLVSHRLEIDRPDRDEGVLLDLLDPKFGPLHRTYSLLMPRSRAQVGPIHRRRFGYVVIPAEIAKRIVDSTRAA